MNEITKNSHIYSYLPIDKFFLNMTSVNPIKYRDFNVSDMLKCINYLKHNSS